MSDTTDGRKPAAAPTILLTSTRQGDMLQPADDLAEVRSSGEWPPMTYWHPEFPDTIFETRAVTRYDEVREVLGNRAFDIGLPKTGAPGSFANRPGIVVFANGDYHRRLRRSINGWFTVRRVQAMQDDVVRIVETLLDNLQAGGSPADLLMDFAMPFPTQVICQVLGIPFGDQHRFEVWTRDITSLRLSSKDTLDAIQQVHDYVLDIVQHHHQHPQDDLISGLINDRVADLTDEEITGLAMNLLIAGQDTTAFTLSLGVLLLLQHPDQRTLLVEDESVVLQAIDEIVRFTSLVPSPHNRMATRDTVIAGRKIEAGDRLIVSLLAANHDPSLVGDADRFDIRRKRVPHLGFGHGEHACVGQHLARLELANALPALLRRLPGLRLTIDASDVDWRTEYARIYGIGRLPVAW